MGIQVTRLYSGPDGESHFEDIEIPLEDKGNYTWRSEVMKATGIYFRERGTISESDWHNAPRRQFAISIEGETEIEIGDGTKRRFGPGDIMLTEDTTGRGHILRTVKPPRKVIIVSLA